MRCEVIVALLRQSRALGECPRRIFEDNRVIGEAGDEHGDAVGAWSDLDVGVVEEVDAFLDPGWRIADGEEFNSVGAFVVGGLKSTDQRRWFGMNAVLLDAVRSDLSDPMAGKKTEIGDFGSS